ncbi:hypothetical protein [Nocardioides sp.]|uniref:hypothetical protein n=1 Tax=Nocardioides sp. TaxID=35761 RepID=UPI0027340E78|nr:hypothetical protein [Nocardioides sp.]MDP3894772.1 hypothetical protein [Nocardioides sp.]
MPRKWADPDHAYGRDAEVGWVAATGLSQQVELAAAKIQHHLILRARIRMVPRRHTYDTLANATSLDASVIGKVFRGDRAMHLTHLAALELVLGDLRSGGT